MLDFIGDVVLSLSVAHAAAISVEVLVILLLLLLFIVRILGFAAETLEDEVQEDSLGDVAQLAQALEVLNLSVVYEVQELLQREEGVPAL